jgi:hypothetical protein
MTNNHDYNAPEQGASDWHVPINENFEQIDRDVEIRDKDSNKGSYEPKDGAKFFATDTGNVYLGDGSSWNSVSVGTSSDSPSFSSVSANEAYVNAQQADAIVYQDGGQTRAVGKDGLIGSGSNPSQVIEAAIQQSRYVVITGDYTLSEEIRVTQSNRVIDAFGATFQTYDDVKLWHLDEGSWNVIRVGQLDLNGSGRVGFDVHGAKGNRIEAKIGSVPGGTFTEDDGNGSATYNRTAFRLKGKASPNRSASYWNRCYVLRPWGTGGTQSGNGITLTSSGDTTDGTANGNIIFAPKVTDYDIGIDCQPGSNGNSFHNVEVTGCNTGLRVRTGKYGNYVQMYGMTWFERCDTGIDIPARNGSGAEAHVQIHGTVSFADTGTDATNWGNVIWNDAARERFNFGHHKLVNHAEGNTSADPSSQGPAGWLEIEQGGQTRHVPYY